MRQCGNVVRLARELEMCRTPVLIFEWIASKRLEALKRRGLACEMT
jgi:hypothetical protein